MEREQAILEAFKENWQHARHVENERLSFTQFYAMIVGVAATVGLQNNDKTTAFLMLALAFFILFLSFLGLMLSHTWGKTFDSHMEKARRAAEALQISEYSFKHSGYTRFTWLLRTRFLFCYYYALVLSLSVAAITYILASSNLASAAFTGVCVFLTACYLSIPPMPRNQPTPLGERHPLSAD